MPKRKSWRLYTEQELQTEIDKILNVIPALKSSQSCEDFEDKINKIKSKYLEKSFICEDKSIHFGKLHVNYVRDIIDMVEEIKDLFEPKSEDK